MRISTISLNVPLILVDGIFGMKPSKLFVYNEVILFHPIIFNFHLEYSWDIRGMI